MILYKKGAAGMRIRIEYDPADGKAQIPLSIETSGKNEWSLITTTADARLAECLVPYILSFERREREGWVYVEDPEPYPLLTRDRNGELQLNLFSYMQSIGLLPRPRQEKDPGPACSMQEPSGKYRTPCAGHHQIHTGEDDKARRKGRFWFCRLCRK